MVQIQGLVTAFSSQLSAPILWMEAGSDFGWVEGEDWLQDDCAPKAGNSLHGIDGRSCVKSVS